MLRRAPAAVLLLTLACAGLPAQASEPAPTSGASDRLPDIELGAEVQMRSIEFGSTPKADVRIGGGPRLAPRHDVERDGLPTPVAPGRGYRGVTVRTTISATLLDPAPDAAAVDAAAPPLPTPPIDEDSP